MANFTPEEISEILEQFFDVVGTRQYIGARYVPIFGRKDEESIAWDNTAPYEPLTIVLYQGNSYTSRTYVPAGAEITNELYWALTGNYNAQIEQYRAEVQQVLENIDTLESIIPNTDFDATNTVKKYIDNKAAEINQNIDETNDLLPSDEFTSVNTVKKYIDDNDNDIENVLPIADFDATNTIKKYIDDNDNDINERIGNIFTNGLIPLNIVRPEQFGATYEAAADTQAFKDMLAYIADTYNGCTVLLTGRYIINEPIEITHGYICFMGLPVTGASSNPSKIVFQDTGRFIVKASGIQFQEIQFYPVSTMNEACITYDVLDMDATIRRCSFTMGKRAFIEIHGRNITIEECVFSLLNDNSAITNYGTIACVLFKHDATIQIRGIQLINNRMHACYGYFLYEDASEYDYEHDILISENFCDINNGPLFFGIGDDVVIENNYYETNLNVAPPSNVPSIFATCIMLHNARPLVINNNAIHKRDNTATYNRYSVITIINNGSEEPIVIIKNNSVTYGYNAFDNPSGSHGIVLNTGAKKIDISNNTFFAHTAPPVFGVYVGGTAEGQIKDNIFSTTAQAVGGITAGTNMIISGNETIS